MLLLITALAAASATVAVDAAGMEPQLRVIREAAGQRSWPITCQGHAGEEAVIRIGVPSGTDQTQVDGFVASVGETASVWRELRAGEALRPGCDLDEPKETANFSQRALAFGNHEELVRLEATARQCGFGNARIRPWIAKDSPWLKPRAGWFALDAGEDSVSRYGPLMCFTNIGRLPALQRGADVR